MENIENIGIYQIKRLNNAVRKYGFIVPGMGRWDNIYFKLNEIFYDFIINKIKNNSNFDFNGNILIIGLSESGLIPSYVFYKLFKKNFPNLDISISLSTREEEFINNNIDYFVFYEDHVTTQHPKHFLKLINQELYYSNIIIIDDEMTTGKTILKLLDQIKHLSNNFFIFNYVDVRINKTDILDIYDNKNIFFNSLMCSNQLEIIDDNCQKIYDLNIKIESIKNYENIIYIIGECIEDAIDKHMNDNSIIRLITHINWEICSLIESYFDLGYDLNNKKYKYYNPIKPLNKSNNYIYYYEWQSPLADNLEKYLLHLNSNIKVIKCIINKK